MKQFYSIHEGEYLTGICLNKEIENCELWIPAKDTGIDILVTNKDDYKKNVSLQVKYSKDFLPEKSAKHQESLRSCGWWEFGQTAVKTSLGKNPKKPRKPVDFWVIVIHSFFEKETDCIVVKTTELYDRFSKFKKASEKEHTYFWITKKNGKCEKCFETRGIDKTQEKELLEGKYNSIDPERDFTGYLNNWEPVKKLLGV